MSCKKLGCKICFKNNKLADNSVKHNLTKIWKQNYPLISFECPICVFWSSDPRSRSAGSSLETFWTPKKWVASETPSSDLPAGCEEPWPRSPEPDTAATWRQLRNGQASWWRRQHDLRFWFARWIWKYLHNHPTTETFFNLRMVKPKRLIMQ